MPSTLSTLVDALNKFSDRRPDLDESRCLNQRHQQAGQCAACIDVCPVAAIVLDPAPQIDPATCLACDACAAACPTSALQGQRSPLTMWREAYRSIHEGTVSLVCRAAGAGQFAATRIPCASALPSEFYIGLALGGVERITIYTADCEHCPLKKSLGQAQSAISNARRFLDSLHDDLDVKQDIGQPPLTEIAPSTISRRGFLSSVFKPGATKPVESDTLDEFMAAGVGWRRAMLLTELVQESGSVEEVILPALDGYWGALAVDDRCIGCQMCVQFCPTDALAVTVDDQDSKVTLWFCAARCTACGLCERACFKHAITLSDEVNLAAITACEFAPVWQGKPSFSPLSTMAKPEVGSIMKSFRETFSVDGE